MPQIRPHSAQISSEATIVGRQAAPTDFGGTGVSDLGTAVQSAGYSAGQAQRILLQNQIRQEATNADTATMKANADLTLELNRRVQAWKPGDPDITEAFHSTVRETFERLQVNDDGENRYATEQGQRHFENRAAHYASQFTIETAKAQATLDGKAAVADHTAMVDSQANMLQLQPAYFDSVREEVKSVIGNPNGIYHRPGISEMDRVALARQAEEALATATVQGTIEQRPHEALAKLQAGWMNTYIPKEKLPVLVNQAQTAVHAIGVEARQAAAAERQRLVDLSHATDLSLVQQRAAHDTDPKVPDVKAGDILNAVRYKGLDAETGRVWLNMLDAEANRGPKPIHTDPNTEHDLFRRIHLPADDPRKIIDTAPIYEAFIKGRLTADTRRDLVRELTDARTPDGEKLGVAKEDFLRSRKSSISRTLLDKLDPIGDAKFGDFRHMVGRKIEQYQKDGKNPHDLFDPTKSDFLGKPEILRDYQTTPEESIEHMSRKFGDANRKLPEVLPPEQTRKPGESYESWRQRQK